MPDDSGSAAGREEFLPAGFKPWKSKVERDLRARFACPPQEETRPEVAFHHQTKMLFFSAQ
jgi:hypothetical protein